MAKRSPATNEIQTHIRELIAELRQLRRKLRELSDVRRERAANIGMADDGPRNPPSPRRKRRKSR